MVVRGQAERSSSAFAVSSALGLLVHSHVERSSSAFVFVVSSALGLLVRSHVERSSSAFVVSWEEPGGVAAVLLN